MSSRRKSVSTGQGGRSMRIALVHDYLNEMGGAERVLRVLADMYSDAPIYTAFSVRGSTAQKAFKDRKVKYGQFIA